MGNIAIQVDHLSKQYRIGSLQQGDSKYKSLREELTKAVRAPIRRAGRLLRGEPYGAAELDETIWALRDVSFEVKHGEAVGIIGPNGAGKTTLLKILSRITEPTEGRAVLHGRVGSLLEVGTGFHPELTGRENIYLNGAILGMRKTHIEHKFDKIVAFSGVEQFIDTPVKHYSSGMRVRLAFSVAAHLEPEILLVDEVLAVGDASFRKKCLGKMSEVTNEGRTVLLVSHNMASIQQLCSQAMLLASGQISLSGDPGLVTSHHLSLGASTSVEVDLRSHPSRGNRYTPIITRLRMLNTHSTECRAFPVGSSIIFEITLNSNGRQFSSPNVGIGVDDPLGQRMCSFLTRSQYGDPWTLDGCQTVQCEWRDCRLRPGLYTLSLSFTDGQDTLDRLPYVASLEIVAQDIYGTGRLDDLSIRSGVFAPDASWHIDDSL